MNSSCRAAALENAEASPSTDFSRHTCVCRRTSALPTNYDHVTGVGVASASLGTTRVARCCCRPDVYRPPDCADRWQRRIDGVGRRRRRQTRDRERGVCSGSGPVRPWCAARQQLLPPPLTERLSGRRLTTVTRLDVADVSSPSVRLFL